MTEKTKIIICYHKETIIVKNEDVFIPIYVGKAIGEDDILEDIQGDDEGDNISYKNKLYCELTGLYWLWKNVDADNYGLFHYRRFLDIKNKYPETVPIHSIDLSDWSEESISEEMENYDIILPVPMTMDMDVYEQYKICHVIEDFDVVLQIIKDDYPDFATCLDGFLYQRDMCIGNVFIMKKALLNEYCTFLFDILGKAESKIDLSNRNSYQMRSLGFMAERIFNIFIRHKIDANPDLKVKYVNLVMFNGI